MEIRDIIHSNNEINISEMYKKRVALIKHYNLKLCMIVSPLWMCPKPHSLFTAYGL